MFTSRKQKKQPVLRTPVVGGTPITAQQAIELRQIAFGSSLVPPRSDWLHSGLVFREGEQPLGFGLVAARSSTRGLLCAVQAAVLKHLLFRKQSQQQQQQQPQQPQDPDALLRPGVQEQREALVNAIADVLWRAGDKAFSCVCLPQDVQVIAPSQTFLPDGVTEKLHLFEFSDLESLQIFIKRYLYLFQEETSPGMMLLLFSAVLTRGVKKVQTDMDSTNAFLIGAAEEGSHCIVMLLLTGRATPYLHNGVVYVGDEDHYALPQFGVLARTEVGLLWDEASSAEDESRKPGSRLKTPSLPVWVVHSSSRYGVIFSTNRELLRNYHAERRFDLHYYTCDGSYCHMGVDTRYEEDHGITRDISRENAVVPYLEKIIHTKWQGARVSCYTSTGDL